jgi:pimeloyl-ACP methyl ester carboxylesterase
MPSVRADDGVSIAYRTEGAGNASVLLLHAWSASGRYFDELVASFDPSIVRSIAVDLRGHGDSDKPEGELSWDRLARDVFAVADSVAVDSFVAVGHSMGGKLAQCLPLVEPARIKGLVLVASPSAAELPTPPFVMEWIELVGNAQAFVDTTIRPYLRHAVPEHVLRRFGENAAKIPRAYLEQTMNLVSSTSFIEKLDTVRVPTLIVSSTEDPVHSTETDIMASLPNARRKVIDSGPEIPMEKPAEMARLIERFVVGAD